MRLRISEASATAVALIRHLAAIGWLRRGLMLVAFSAAGLFLAHRIGRADLASMTANADIPTLVLIGISALLYAGGMVLLAMAWGVLASAGRPFPGSVATIGAYGLSVLPKYIPGSVFQYVSRQALGARVGWAQRAMARASVVEALLHLLCAALVALTFFKPQLGAAAAFCAALAFLRLGSARRSTTIAYVLQLVFFALNASMVVLLAREMAIGGEVVPRVAAAYLVAWIAGFLVPVAPGGLGVREAVGVALMEGVIGTHAILWLMAAMRIINLLGDVAMVALSALCRAADRTGRPARSI
jgi:hypothetical protein